MLKGGINTKLKDKLPPVFAKKKKNTKNVIADKMILFTLLIVGIYGVKVKHQKNETIPSF